MKLNRTILLQRRRPLLQSVKFVVALVITCTLAYLAVQSIDEACGLMLWAALPTLLLYNRPMKLNTVHYILFALTFWMLIAGLLNINYATTPIRYPVEGKEAFHMTGGYGMGFTLSHMGMWWLFIAYTSRDYSKQELRLTVSTYVNLITILCYLLIASNPDIANWENISRGGIPFLTFPVNANFFPYFIVPMICICLMRLFTCFRVADLIRVVLGVMCLALLRSRGGIVACVLGVFLIMLYLLIVLRKDRKGWIKIAVLALCVIAVLEFYCYIKYIRPDIYRVWFRFGGDSGRSDLWSEGLGYMQSSKDLWFGNGWGYFYYKNPMDFVAFYGYHNFFIQYLTGSGLMSVILVSAAGVVYLVRTHDILGFGLLAVQFAHMAVENGLTPIGFLFLILVYTMVKNAEKSGNTILAQYCVEARDEHRLLQSVTTDLPKFVRVLTVH